MKRVWGTAWLWIMISYLGMAQVVVDPADNVASTINNAQPGDTIYLSPGFYSGRLDIEIQGGWDQPVVITSLDTSFEQMAVIDGRADRPSFQANDSWLRIRNSQWLEIVEVQFQNGWTDPIDIESSSFISFKRCIFTGGRRLINAEGPRTSHILVENCFWDQGATYMWNIDVWSDDNAWHSLHSGNLRFFNGSLFTTKGTAGHHVIRGNTIQYAFNGLRWNGEEGKDENIEIYENRISHIRDNDFEPERYANNLFIRNNRSHNVHKTLSIDNVNGGNIYYFGNVITTDNTSRTRSIATGFYKIYGEDRNLSQPVYIFNNSFYGTGRVHGSINNRVIQHVIHVNNAYDLTRREWELDQWNETLRYNHDISNKPFSNILIDNGQEQHGIVDDPLFSDPLESRDVSLSAASPAVDAGTFVELPGIYWTQRYDQEAPDIGAFELDKMFVGPHFQSTDSLEHPRITQVISFGDSMDVSFSTSIDPMSVAGGLVVTSLSGDISFPVDFNLVHKGQTVRLPYSTPIQSVDVTTALRSKAGEQATQWANASHFSYQPYEEIVHLLPMTVGNGTVVVSTDRRILMKGDTITLIAMSQEGSRFTGWSGDMASGDSIINAVLDRSMWLIANFGELESEEEEVSVEEPLSAKTAREPLLYPNPTNDFLFLTTDMGTISDITLSDMSGRVRLKPQIDQNMISLKTVPAGLYILKFSYNSKKFTQRVFKID